MARINQDLDEGSDVRAIKLADTRAAIRALIEDEYGLLSWTKAHNLAIQYYMCAQTVIRFASGETRKPSSYTIHCMIKASGYELVLVPLGTSVPNSKKFE